VFAFCEAGFISGFHLRLLRLVEDAMAFGCFKTHVTTPCHYCVHAIAKAISFVSRGTLQLARDLAKFWKLLADFFVGASHCLKFASLQVQEVAASQSAF